MRLKKWQLAAAADLAAEQHGDRARDAIEAKIEYLFLLGDAEGVETWTAIARQLPLPPASNAAKGAH